MGRQHQRLAILVPGLSDLLQDRGVRHPDLVEIDPSSRITQALVLAPTRELALQVAEAFGRDGAHLSVNVLPVYGGASYGP